MNEHARKTIGKNGHAIFLSCFLILLFLPQIVLGQSPWETGSFYPPWSNISPIKDIVISENEDLEAAVRNLQPGDRLLLNPGTYTITERFSVNIQGTAAAPIWIAAVDRDNKPIIVQQDAQVTIDVENSAQYLVFQNLEITGGVDLMRLRDVSNIWIDQCYLHDGLGIGIAANTPNTNPSFLYITRNEIENPGTSRVSDGIYLGSNDGTNITSDSIIALNHIHHTEGEDSPLSDGIDIKEGSYNNWIVENAVHNNSLSSIVTGGTGGSGINLIERNTLYKSSDITLRVAGEAIVRNNLIMDENSVGAFTSQPSGPGHSPTNVAFIHNTIVSLGRGATLREWQNGTSMVFANNVVYSRDASSIDFSDSTGVVVTGNVVLGLVQGVNSGFVVGNGLEDFVDVAWDASSMNASPSPASAFRGAGDPAYAVEEDINGIPRVGALDSGAFSFIPFPQCNDGVDNDGDTLIDLEDPGCEDTNDNDETDPIISTSERDQVTMQIYESNKKGITVLVRGRVIDADPTRSYSGQVTLDGSNLVVNKECQDISASSPVYQEKTPKVENFKCELNGSKITVTYKAFNQEVGVEYSGSIKIYQDSDLVVSGQGSVELVEAAGAN